MAPYIFSGLAIGSIFAIAAVGLVLTYKTSGIFNLAQGAMASASAFILYFLMQDQGIPATLAIIICVFVWGPLLGLLLELLARRLTGVTLTMKILATVGILLTIQGGIDLVYKPGVSRTVPQFLPVGDIDIFGTAVTANKVITFALGLLMVVGLTVFLRSTRSGLAMRAVVDNTELLDITGISPARTRRLAWVIGSTLASASGVLLAPLLPLNSSNLTLLVVTAFGAAAIGGFTNLPLTYLGGLAIGVAQTLSQKWFGSSTGILNGLSSALPFLVLFAFLLFSPRIKSPSATSNLQRRPESSWTAPWTVRGTGLILILVVLLLVPEFAGVHIGSWTRMLAYTILFLSLGILVRTSGQVSFGHVGFMAIGVTTFAHVVGDSGWPWLVGLLFVALIAMPVGALLAIPAIRFPGLYLALATLGFSLCLQYMFYGQNFMFGGNDYGLVVPRPTASWATLDDDRGFYYVVLAITAVVVAGFYFLTRGRLGRLLTAMSDSPAGLEASGTAVKVSRVLVFCLSASLAAVAGALDGASITIVNGGAYGSLLSIQLFAVTLLVIGKAPFYAVMAGVAQIVIPSYISTDPSVTSAFTVLFGVSAIAVSISPPQQLPEWARRGLDKLAWNPRKKSRKARRSDVSVAAAAAQLAQPTSLKVDKVTVRFGGLTAADNISLEAPTGRITGLIGPNGAGKSTVFNACAGVYRPQSGTVSLGGTSLGREGVPTRARRGLGRTFQQMELFDSMTVRQNVAMGAEAAYAGWNPLSHVLSTRSQRSAVSTRSDDALELCGLVELADKSVGSLSTGQRRLVELARCLAGTYDLLLLDEPSSGLDHTETGRFGEILRVVAEQRGVGILLIEHDMSLINELCEYVYVIDFGKPIFEGTVAEVGASELVRAAYLGREGLGDELETDDELEMMDKDVAAK